MRKTKHATGGATPVLVRELEPGTIALSPKALTKLTHYFRELIAQAQEGGAHE